MDVLRSSLTNPCFIQTGCISPSDHFADREVQSGHIAQIDLPANTVVHFQFTPLRTFVQQKLHHKQLILNKDVAVYKTTKTVKNSSCQIMGSFSLEMIFSKWVSI